MSNPSTEQTVDNDGEIGSDIVGDESSIASGGAEAKPRRRRRWWVVASVLAIAAGGTSIALLTRSDSPDTASNGQPSLSVAAGGGLPAGCAAASSSVVTGLVEQLVFPNIGGVDHVYSSVVSAAGQQETLVAARLLGSGQKDAVGLWGVGDDGTYHALNSVAAQFMADQTAAEPADPAAAAFVVSCTEASAAAS